MREHFHERGDQREFSTSRTVTAVIRRTLRQIGPTPGTAAGTFVGPAVIRAGVTVDGDADTYSGWYTLSTYAGSPNNGTEFNESGTPLVTFTATIRAKRVKVR